MRVGNIQRQPDGDRLAVVQNMASHLFQLVRGPVAEVERPGRPHLERVAACADVLDVQCGAAIDKLLHGRHVPALQRGGPALQKLEERGVLDERNLDGLGDTLAPDPVWLRR